MNLGDLNDMLSVESSLYLTGKGVVLFVHYTFDSWMPVIIIIVVLNYNYGIKLSNALHVCRSL